MEEKLICCIAGRLLAEYHNPETLTVELAKEAVRECVGWKQMIEYLEIPQNFDKVTLKMKEYLN